MPQSFIQRYLICPTFSPKTKGYLIYNFCKLRKAANPMFVKLVYVLDKLLKQFIVYQSC